MGDLGCLPSSLFLFQSRSYNLVWLPCHTALPSIPAVMCSCVTKFKELSGVLEVMYATPCLVT